MNFQALHASRNAESNELPLLFFSSNEENINWITHALNEWTIIHQTYTSIDTQLAHIKSIHPHLLLLDFSDNSLDASDASSIIKFIQDSKSLYPELLLISVGTTSNHEGAVLALRAGIRHFIDISEPVEAAREVVRKLIPHKTTEKKQTLGSVITLLGVRPGMGTTTLAVHLADLIHGSDTDALQRRATDKQRVCLLDFGLPSSDGQMYLNVTGTFNLIDLIRNKHRLDQTLIQTAVAHSKNGVKVISLPRDLYEMSKITAKDATTLLAHLRSYFDTVIIDFGGYNDMTFIKHIASASDQTWVVSDQSLGALVSMSNMVKDLNKDLPTPKNIGVIINRFDERYGLSSEKIAERFNLPLLGVIPECAVRLISNANLGMLMHEDNKKDPYVRAVRELTTKIIVKHKSATENSSTNSWLQRAFSSAKNTNQKPRS